MREKYTKKHKYDGFRDASMALRYIANYAKTRTNLSRFASTNAEEMDSPIIACTGVWNSKLIQALYA